MVSGRNNTLTMRLDGDIRDFRREMAGAGRDLDAFQRSTGQMSRTVGAAFTGVGIAAAAATAVIAAGGATLRGLIGDATAAARSQAILEGALRASGGAAGVSLGSLNAYADGLMKATGISDEAIKESEAVLLTFRNVTQPIFQETLELAADMSVVFGQDLSSSAVQLGKAIQDPVEGITALRRIGVQLTNDQEEQIKKFVELGDVAKAQRVVLNEVASQVGGVARATGESSGQVARLTESFGELREAAGAAALEGLSPLLEDTIAWAQSDDALQMARDFGEALAGIAEKGADVLKSLNEIRDSSPWRAVIEILTVGSRAAEMRPEDPFESLQSIIAGATGGRFGGSLFGVGGESPWDRQGRRDAHAAGEDWITPESWGGLMTAPTGPTLGVDPTRPVGPGNPAVNRNPRPTSGGVSGGAAKTGPKGPTAFSAASLGLIQQLTTGLPDFTGGLDEAGLEEFRRAEREFKAIRASVNRDLAVLGLTMADLDARGLETSAEFKGMEDRAGALQDALKRIDLTEDLRLTPWKDAIDAVSLSIEKNLEAQKQMSDSLFELAQQFLNVKIDPGAQAGFQQFFGGGAVFGSGGEFGFRGADVVVP